MKRVVGVVFLICVALAAVGAQDWTQPPAFGEARLSSGFSPDPYVVTLLAGGTTEIDDLGYYGYVADAPDFRLHYDAGTFDLTFRVENADGDTLLLISAPDGSWFFNDDTNGLDPAHTFRNPQSGQYDIWVGTFDGDFVDADLIITEF
jgi:hypothetical protein